MASTKRQRELARQRAARQAAARAAAQQKKRRRNFIAGGTAASVLIVVLVVVLILANTGGSSNSPAASANPSATPTATASGTAAPTAAASASATADTRALACGITTAPAQAMVSHKFAAAPATEITAGTNYTMSITTNCGVITANLDAAKAPKTVNSFYFLARQKFFTGTECHRETGAAAGTATPSAAASAAPTGLFVLQCGDPTGTGAGGPGYTIPDENLPAAGSTVYPRGTLAMANSGANTNGSQFFLVDKDSALGPQYTVFGTITPAGLATLDKIAALGIQGGTADGKPAQRIFIDTLTVAKAA